MFKLALASIRWDASSINSLSMARWRGVLKYEGIIEQSPFSKNLLPYIRESHKNIDNKNTFHLDLEYPNQHQLAWCVRPDQRTLLWLQCAEVSYDGKCFKLVIWNILSMQIPSHGIFHIQLCSKINQMKAEVHKAFFNRKMQWSPRWLYLSTHLQKVV